MRPRETTENPSGLVLSGIVRDRSRRYININNSQTEIVTYVVIDNLNHRYYVDDFAPSDYIEIGDPVSVPVYIKPYRKRNGDPSYSLCFQKEYHSIKGEAF